MAKKLPPLVTVLLPVFNGQDYVAQTIDSVLNQSYQNIELIIIDDGSSDDSRKILAQYASKYPKQIIYIENASNISVGRSLVIAHKKAKGDYIAQIGHDDIYDKHQIKTHLEAIQKNDAIASFCKIQYVDSKTKPIDDQNIFYHQRIDKFNQHDFFIELLKGNFLCAPSSVFKNFKGSENLWGYANDLLQDYELWLNLALRGKFVYNKDATVKYRIHSANLSAPDSRINQSKFEFYSCLQRILFTDCFNDFYKQASDKVNFARKTISALYILFNYCPPLEVLVTSLIENLSLELEGEKNNLLYELASFYQNIGMLSKAYLMNSKKLPKKIPLIFEDNKKLSNIHKLFKKSQVFVPKQIHDATETDLSESFIIFYYQSLDFCMEDYRYAQAVEDNRVIIIATHKNITEAESNFPNALVYTINDFKTAKDIQNKDFKLIRHYEDKLWKYFSAPFIAPKKHNKSSGVVQFDKVIIPKSNEVVNFINIPKIPDKNRVYITHGNTELDIIQESNHFTIKNDQKSNLGKDIILKIEPAAFIDYFCINNHIYTVDQIDHINGQIIGFAKKVSLYLDSDNSFIYSQIFGNNQQRYDDTKALKNWHQANENQQKQNLHTLSKSPGFEQEDYDTVKKYFNLAAYINFASHQQQIPEIKLIESRYFVDSVNNISIEINYKLDFGVVEQGIYSDSKKTKYRGHYLLPHHLLIEGWVADKSNLKENNIKMLFVTFDNKVISIIKNDIIRRDVKESLGSEYNQVGFRVNLSAKQFGLKEHEFSLVKSKNIRVFAIHNNGQAAELNYLENYNLINRIGSINSNDDNVSHTITMSNGRKYFIFNQNVKSAFDASQIDSSFLIINGWGYIDIENQKPLDKILLVFKGNVISEFKPYLKNDFVVKKFSLKNKNLPLSFKKKIKLNKLTSISHNEDIKLYGIYGDVASELRNTSNIDIKTIQNYTQS